MKIKQHQGTAIAKQLLAKLGSKINAVALVVALFASAMLNAQTQKVYPTYFKGHDISEILASSDPDMRQIYLYNVGLKKAYSSFCRMILRSMYPIAQIAG